MGLGRFFPLFSFFFLPALVYIGSICRVPLIVASVAVSCLILGTDCWLELSTTDMHYWWCLPAGYAGQGAFPFDAGCAAKIAKARPRKSSPLRGAKNPREQG